LHAAADAVNGALVAHHARLRDGLGQHVDVSVQQSVTQTTLSSIVASALGHENFSFGAFSKQPETKKTLDLSGSGARTRRSKWRIVDGLVEMHLGMGPASGGKTNNFFAWMREEGMLPEKLQSWDWITIPKAITDGLITEEDMEEAREATAAFLSTRRKAEIIGEAMRRKILLAPIYTMEDLVNSPHHRARGFFQTVNDRGHERILPGDFALGIAEGFTPLAQAPALGQDNDILTGLAACPWPAPAVSRPVTAPFDGLKVVDLAWVVAGPAIGRVLADYGATVIRIESAKRVDTARLMGPFPDGKLDREHSALYETYNAGKLGLELDLAQEEAQAIVRDLVTWADVLVESFAPGQMQRWGLGYETLRAINPHLVMLSTSLMGQSGPYVAFAGFGNIGAAVSGFQNIVGWPDALPIGPFGPYTDFVGPRFALAALLAALDHRGDKGQGCWIDVSQAEAGMQFLAPAIADFAATGRITSAMGNRDPQMAPHGVFPALGEDRWIALAVRDDAEWSLLARTVGGEAKLPDFVTLAGRKAGEDQLEAIIGAWTAGQSPEALEAALQGLGIPAHVVANSTDMMSDAQLASRGHFVWLKHERGGKSLIEASRFMLSATPAAYRRTAPAYGRDNEYVLRQILGHDDERISRLRATNVLS
jgi:crotonobetainyl-CoA:carnitine CoA-transferase CaiB-like acyl-CoA transferase